MLDEIQIIRKYYWESLFITNQFSVILSNVIFNGFQLLFQLTDLKKLRMKLNIY